MALYLQMIFGRSRHPSEGVAGHPHSTTGGFLGLRRQELFMFARDTLVLVIKKTRTVSVLLLLTESLFNTVVGCLLCSGARLGPHLPSSPSVLIQ